MHADALLVWLNRWGCRLSYDVGDRFAAELRSWSRRWERSLPPVGTVLADLDDVAVDLLAAAAADLAARELGTRRLHWTAAAKLLYALRPDAVPPWDDAIAVEAGGKTEDGFRSHLLRARGWARALGDEASAAGVDDVPAFVGRPSASVARIIDEWLYLTVTRGLRPGRRR